MINRLPRNIKDNLSFEHFNGKNQLEQVRRIFRLPGQKNIDSNLFKPMIGTAKFFEKYRVPLWAWQEYYKERQKLANQSLEKWRESADMESAEGFIPLTEGLILCKDNNVRWSLSTIQQNISRGVLIGQKVNRELYVNEESLKRAIEAETYKPPKKKTS